MIDSLLLERYVAGHDTGAFDDLVARHGPAVYRTCRALLHDDHAAEDAFQATFLIFIRRAPSIRDPETLGRWLTGVARRVAARSRRRSARQSDRERRWASMQPTNREPERPAFEIEGLVREELGQLPERYRQALTLCYLEGLSCEQAAGRIGCPVGTVKTRVVRARRLLRDRLDRRGVALGIALLLLFLRRPAGAAPPEALGASTVLAMRLAASVEIATLEARFPRATDLARTSRLPGIARGRGPIPFGLAVVAAVAIGVVGMAWQVKAAQSEVIAASAKLARLLDAACR